MLAIAFAISTTIAAQVPMEIDKFDKDVAATRTGGVDFLKRQQKQDGSWEGVLIISSRTWKAERLPWLRSRYLKLECRSTIR
jgi:hypothetical protein